MFETVELEASIDADMQGLRVDQALAKLFPDFSRSRLQQWIKHGEATVNGRKVRPKDRVNGGENIIIRATLSAQFDDQPAPIALDIYLQDDHVLVINKPVGLVVHPGAGNREGTMLNALLHHDPSLSTLPRAGIVHRLDKDTSGLMVVARTHKAHKHLIDALKERQVIRHYDAIVNGTMTAGGRIDAPIARHRTRRTKMTVHHSGKPAATQYRVIRRFKAHTWIRATLESGRTHQIRVHMTHIGHPLLGDLSYGGRPRFPPGASDDLITQIQAFKRQALHATRLTFVHPHTGETVSLEAPLPEDMSQLLKSLGQQS